MKIKNKTDNSKVRKSITSQSQVKKVQGKEIDFLEELKQVHGEKIKAELDELLGMIDNQGERLAHHRTFRELVKYKKMVKNFVEKAVDKMYNLQEDYNPTQGKVQTLVKSIDSSLEELT
jgi:uncharacterized protein YaaR (DUF327 family)